MTYVGAKEYCRHIIVDIFAIPILKVIKEKIGIDISIYKIESDNGAALSAICKKYKCIHLRCLRHFLVSLGTKPYSKQIGELVSAKCQLDFDTLCDLYKDSFASFAASDNMKDFQKTLGKAGLHFDINTLKVEIIDHTVWSAVSQMHRIALCMPSTTNSLEASHGHLNEKLPRRNDFWTGMKRLIEFLIVKENGFKKALKCNFTRALRVLEKTTKLNMESMEQQKSFYSTSLTHCNCGETLLISKLYRTQIPCSHIYSISRTFPKFPDNLKLKLSKSIYQLDIEYENVSQNDKDQEMLYENVLKVKAVKNIRKFSHYKKEKVIMQAIDDLIPGDEFANGLPLGFHKMVEFGIRKFSS